MPAKRQSAKRGSKGAQAEAATASATATTESPQIYCVKCKTKTATNSAEQVVMKNGRPATRGTCAVCGTSKYRIGALAT